MTDLPKRRRGRPSKADVAAREAMAAEIEREAAASAEAAEDAYLDEVLNQPFQRRRRGIQPTPENLRIVYSIAKLAATQAEIAAALGIALRTFQDFMTAYPEVREAYETGLEHCKMSLRRKQFKFADKNAPMAIFLGKNLLGQKDIHENHNVNAGAPAATLTNEELMQIIESGKSAAKAGLASNETSTRKDMH